LQFIAYHFMAFQG